jgi:hypothetical protein
VPFLADLLRSDSIYIGSNITFGNLAPLSTFLGKPGDTAKGGLPFEEYMRRQDLHRRAEINALLDTPSFISRARDLYGYPNVVCDTGGSICEVVDPDDPEDEVLRTLSAHTLMVWIEGTEAHTDELIRRFDAAPKPMYYQPGFPQRAGQEYLDTTGLRPTRWIPTPSCASPMPARWPIARRFMPRWRENWGVTVTAEEVARCATPPMSRLVAAALGRHRTDRLGRRPRAEASRPPCPSACPPPCPPSTSCATRASWSWAEARRTGRTSAPCASGS